MKNFRTADRIALAAVFFAVCEGGFYLLFVILGVGPVREMCAVSVAVAFLFSLCVLLRTGRDVFITAGMMLTTLADLILGFTSGGREWAVLIFLFAQTAYFCFFAVRYRLSRRHILLRVGLSATGGAICAVILGENVNLLAVLSIVYIVNLAHNIAVSLTVREQRLFSIGLILFLMCDLCLGLSMAGEFAGLPPSVTEAFSRVNCWYFYLPAQTIIPLTPLFCGNNRARRSHPSDDGTV